MRGTRIQPCRMPHLRWNDAEFTLYYSKQSSVVLHSPFFLHSVISALEKRCGITDYLSAIGKKHSIASVSLNHSQLSWAALNPAIAAATVLLQNSVGGVLVLLEHLHVGKQELLVKWPHKRKRYGNINSPMPLVIQFLVIKKRRLWYDNWCTRSKVWLNLIFRETN